MLKAAKAKEVEANNSTDEEEIHRLLMESAELNKQADKICDSMKGVDVDVNYHDLVLNSTAKRMDRPRRVSTYSPKCRPG